MTIACALLPSLAQALSCTPWGVTDAYLGADAAEELFVPVLGTLTFDETELPPVVLDRQDRIPPVTEILARFEGHVLAPTGSGAPFNLDVTLRVFCAGPWCAHTQSGPVLAFFEKVAEGYAIAVEPCGGALFNSPTPDQVEAVRACLRGTRCAPTGFR